MQVIAGQQAKQPDEISNASGSMVNVRIDDDYHSKTLISMQNDITSE